MEAIKSTGFRRGEVYYVRYDNGIGSEEAVGRPYVIVSSEEGNKSSALLTVVPLTTSFRYIGVGVELNTLKRQSWALCTNITTLDKSRFGDRMCVLTAGEMAKIDAALAKVLGLPVINEKKQAEHEKQIKIMGQAVKDAEKAVADSKTEIEILKRAYERVLDKLVDQRIERDITARTMVSDPAPAEVEAPVSEPEEALKLIDINRCSYGELKELNFSDNIAVTIITNRPYMKVEDLKTVPGVTRVAYGLVEKKITVGDTAEFRKKKASSPKAVIKTEWDKPITWTEFKNYSHEKQVECLTYFRDKWGCSQSMVSKMMGVTGVTFRTHIMRHNLRGILVSYPKQEVKDRFEEWLKNEKVV